MIFTLDVRRARKGDCLVLHFGTRTNRGIAVIDGGPSKVYRPHLLPRLAEIRAGLGLGAAEALPIDLLMVSHIDDDHIVGVLELTRDLVEAQRDRKPLPFKVRRVWHNTFDDIVGNDPGKLLAAVTAHFGPASLAGDPHVDGLDPDAARVLASVSQGMRLRDDLKRLKLRLNPEFGGSLVMAAKGAKSLDLGKGLQMRVIGPMKPELKALQAQHDAFLKARGGTATAALAAFSDTSVPNLSSIIVLAEAGGRRMLLTGDARGDKILEGLELAGVLRPAGTIHVDVLKMPHHGSDRNMARSFLERITADHYVFSGDGEHGNPERATLEMLREARGETAEYAIHLTYPVDEIDRARKQDWEKERRKEVNRKKTKPNTVVRAGWSSKTHGLAAFFADHHGIGAKLRIVSNGAPHLLELLEPAGI